MEPEYPICPKCGKLMVYYDNMGREELKPGNPKYGADGHYFFYICEEHDEMALIMKVRDKWTTTFESLAPENMRPLVCHVWNN